MPKHDLDWLARSRFQQREGTSLPSLNLSPPLTPPRRAAEMTRQWLHAAGFTGWNSLLGERRVCRGSTVNGEPLINGFSLRAFQSSAARSLLGRKDAFRGGEEPISRGQPKINKPYAPNSVRHGRDSFPSLIFVGFVSQKMFAGSKILFTMHVHQLLFNYVHYLTITEKWRGKICSLHVYLLITAFQLKKMSLWSNIIILMNAFWFSVHTNLVKNVGIFSFHCI